MLPVYGRLLLRRRDRFPELSALRSRNVHVGERHRRLPQLRPRHVRGWSRKWRVHALFAWRSAAAEQSDFLQSMLGWFLPTELSPGFLHYLRLGILFQHNAQRCLYAVREGKIRRSRRDRRDSMYRLRSRPVHGFDWSIRVLRVPARFVLEFVRHDPVHSLPGWTSFLTAGCPLVHELHDRQLRPQHGLAYVHEVSRGNLRPDRGIVAAHSLRCWTATAHAGIGLLHRLLGWNVFFLARTSPVPTLRRRFYQWPRRSQLYSLLARILSEFAPAELLQTVSRRNISRCIRRELLPCVRRRNLQHSSAAD